MQARLIESVEIAPEVRHFVFESPGKIEFSAGQFVSFTDIVHGKKITRAYSIASAPDESNRFELCLNLVHDGAFSPHLFEMRPGDSVEMRPPLGQFVMRRPERETVLIATGTGIAPFRSMLRAHLKASSPRCTLLFGVRHEWGLLYRAEFETITRCFPQFRFLPTLTRPESSWTGLAGRVQAHLLEAIDERRDIDLYLCGLKAMVDDVRNILKDMGFDRRQIFAEKYD